MKLLKEPATNSNIAIKVDVENTNKINEDLAMRN